MSLYFNPFGNAGVSIQTVDVVLVKLKWKITKNPCHCSKILLQWKFQIDLRNLALKQTFLKMTQLLDFELFKLRFQSFC